MWVWRQRYERARRARGHRLRVHLRKPGRRGRGHAAPSPRADLRLPVHAAGARARACRRRAPRRLRACALLDERSSPTDERVIHEDDAAVTYVPYAARWPYEAHVCMREHRPSLPDCEPSELTRAGGRAAAPRAGLRRAVLAAVPVRDGRPPGADPPGSGSAGTCTSSSIRPCARPRSSSTSPAPSRAPGRSSPTSCPRSPPRAARGDHPWPA